MRDHRRQRDMTARLRQREHCASGEARAATRAVFCPSGRRRRRADARLNPPFTFAAFSFATKCLAQDCKNPAQVIPSNEVSVDERPVDAGLFIFVGRGARSRLPVVYPQLTGLSPTAKRASRIRFPTHARAGKLEENAELEYAPGNGCKSGALPALRTLRWKGVNSARLPRRGVRTCREFGIKRSGRATFSG